MRRSLPLTELIAVLDGWNGCAVAVRIVTRPDDLVAAFEGRLGRRTDAKHPSTWWPLECSREPAGAEQSGVYLHSELVEDAALREGGWVVQWRQAGTVVNIRRTDVPKLLYTRRPRPTTPR